MKRILIAAMMLAPTGAAASDGCPGRDIIAFVAMGFRQAEKPRVEAEESINGILALAGGMQPWAIELIDEAYEAPVGHDDQKIERAKAFARQAAQECGV